MWLFILCCAVLFYVILYFVIKAAVRNAIAESKSYDADESEIKETTDKIAQKNCPKCNESHDIDYPKCPYCGHRYVE